MKLTNLNDTIVISTSLTRETIEKALRYAPDSLVVYKDRTAVFAVSTARRSEGEISPHGIAFAKSNADGTMFVSHNVCELAGESPDQRKALMNDAYGLILFNLKKVEEQVAVALNLAAEDINAIAESVVVIE